MDIIMQRLTDGNSEENQYWLSKGIKGYSYNINIKNSLIIWINYKGTIENE